MATTPALRLDIGTDGIARITFDQPGSRANTLNQGVLAELEQIAGQLEAAAGAGRASSSPAASRACSSPAPTSTSSPPPRPAPMRRAARFSAA